MGADYEKIGPSASIRITKVAENVKIFGNWLKYIATMFGGGVPIYRYFVLVAVCREANGGSI